MNLVHVHLVLNHVPVIGVAFAFLLLLYGILRRNDDLTKAALIAFVALALVAIPAYLTGEPAERAIANHPGIMSSAIETHEDAAGAALTGVELVGAGALGLLILYRRRPVPVKVSVAALALALVLSGMMAWTANLGGKIHHTEIAGTPGASTTQPEHDD